MGPFVTMSSPMSECNHFGVISAITSWCWIINEQKTISTGHVISLFLNSFVVRECNHLLVAGVPNDNEETCQGEEISFGVISGLLLHVWLPWTDFKTSFLSFFSYTANNIIWHGGTWVPNQGYCQNSRLKSCGRCQARTSTCHSTSSGFATITWNLTTQLRQLFPVKVINAYWKLHFCSFHLLCLVNLTFVLVIQIQGACSYMT